MKSSNIQSSGFLFKNLWLLFLEGPRDINSSGHYAKNYECFYVKRIMTCYMIFKEHVTQKRNF